MTTPTPATDPSQPEEDAERQEDLPGLPGESHEERLQREHEQLFHELRAVIPGAQVLFAFLLTLAFTQRFEDLSKSQRWVFIATFAVSAAALVLLLAPTAYHRVQFRQDDKELMLRIANVEAIVAMCGTGLAMSGVAYLIGSVVLSVAAGVVMAVCLMVAWAVMWWAIPIGRRLARRRRPASDAK